MRLYFRQHLTELVRLFGYRDVPLDEARELLKPLNETYGLDTMKIAVEEIIFIDGSSDRPIARLTDHARKLAVGILGSPRMSLATAETATSDITQETQDRTRDVTPPVESSDANHGQAESEVPPIPKQSATSRVNKRRRKPSSEDIAECVEDYCDEKISPDAIVILAPKSEMIAMDPSEKVTNAASMASLLTKSETALATAQRLRRTT